MSYRDKQKFERVIDFLSKAALFIYVFAVLEVFVYVIGLDILFIDIRSISIEKYACCVVATIALGYVVQRIANKVREDFIKRLKYSK